MHLLDLTLPRSVDNVALDEALLESAEVHGGQEVLRLWESAEPIVVLGRSSPIHSEVNLDFCKGNGIEVFRRCSGGASVVVGKGVLMYAVLLDYRLRPELRMLENAHRFVMSKIREAVERLGIKVEMQGTCDLTIDQRKFSGNALRCKRNWLIYHGTLLCDFDLNLIQSCLGTPVRQPDYRVGRSHIDFLTQLPVKVNDLKDSLIEVWNANEVRTEWPESLTKELAVNKYDTNDWTYKI